MKHTLMELRTHAVLAWQISQALEAKHPNVPPESQWVRLTALERLERSLRDCLVECIANGDSAKALVIRELLGEEQS